MERNYTVAELCALRSVCETKVVWGWYSGPHYGANQSCVSSRSFGPGEVERSADILVRQHILCGHTAEDLIASEPRPVGTS